MEPDLPIEFWVLGTPVSLQTKNPSAREEWKERVRYACREALNEGFFVIRDDLSLSVTLYYFPETSMQGDIDNIIKPILDALNEFLYADDHQIDRVLVQRFMPGNLSSFLNPTPVLDQGLSFQRPNLYIRIADCSQEVE